MKQAHVLTLAVMAACLASLPLQAAAPVVAGFERYGRVAADDAQRIEAGLVLLGELGCVNCHAGSPEAMRHLLPKAGPALDRVGARLRPEWILRYVQNPHGTKPGTTMPDVLAGLPAEKRQHAAKALAYFLISTGGFADGWGNERPAVRPQEGLAVYERSGCAACHGSRKPDVAALPGSVPLGDLDGKWSPQSLDEFLKNPLAARPSSRMPATQLSDHDRQQLVAALVPKQLEYRSPFDDVVAFNGQAWLARINVLDDMASLGQPARSAPVTGFDVAGLAQARDAFVVRLDGFFHAPLDGAYAFHLASDDGSRLRVADTVVVDHDGPHPMNERTGKITLAAGVHPIRIDYFEIGADEGLAVDVTPPSGGRRSLLAHATPVADGMPAFTTRRAEAEDPPFAVDAGLVAEGRRLFADVGCASCHAMPNGSGHQLAAASQPVPLADMQALAAGCLMASPVEHGGAGPAAARYGLDELQRAVIVAAVSWLKTPAAAQSPTRGQQVDRSFTALNCYACHVRDGKGGTVPAVALVDDDGEPVLIDQARDALFTAVVAELGEETRIPPSLTGAGDKFAAEFLTQVLHDGGQDRVDYMHTRMPRWNGPVADPLAALLAGDPKTSTPVPPLDGFVAAEIAEQGRKLCGSAGLGCIKCHSFGGQMGQSLGVIDMTRMPKRLRHEWFLAYVANPQQFRPGTRMPAAWPEGKTFFANVLDGTAAGQIESVWRYVSERNPAPAVGLMSNSIELVPTERPIIYRNFIEGAGPRAIGVGYPERVNIAWDANALRLALVWKGGFIDANRHWNGRGDGFQPPLGDGVFAADGSTPLAVFADDADLATGKWPTGAERAALGPAAGYVFQGYRLDAAGRPAFRWRWADCTVIDTIEPATFPAGANAQDLKVGLKRTLTIAGSPSAGTVAFRAATGERITAEADGWHLVDGRWRVRVADREADVYRGDGGRVELRVPLVWKPRSDGGVEAAIVEELTW